MKNVDLESGTTRSKLLLIFVAFHPGMDEVNRLISCLGNLSTDISYAVVSNDHRDDEPIERLAQNAKLFIKNKNNPGYGAAANQILKQRFDLPPLIAIANTDITWDTGTFEAIARWMLNHADVTLAVPRIIDRNGKLQRLCKRNPTVLALLSRRFIPERIKPDWLRSYDEWFCMGDKDYSSTFEVSYLSGCCMIIRSSAFRLAGGFDESYFLYLEDADLTRRISHYGRCVHLAEAQIIHEWKRGSHTSLRLTLVNLLSAWTYWRKWGMRLW